LELFRKVEERGKRRSLTEKLLIEAKENNAKTCVSHASLIEESVYKNWDLKHMERHQNPDLI
jgi:hypothetical protein